MKWWNLDPECDLVNRGEQYPSWSTVAGASEKWSEVQMHESEMDLDICLDSYSQKSAGLLLSLPGLHACPTHSVVFQSLCISLAEHLCVCVCVFVCACVAILPPISFLTPHSTWTRVIKFLSSSPFIPFCEPDCNTYRWYTSVRGNQHSCDPASSGRAIWR